MTIAGQEWGCAIHEHRHGNALCVILFGMRMDIVTYTIHMYLRTILHTPHEKLVVVKIKLYDVGAHARVLRCWYLYAVCLCIFISAVPS